MMHDFDLIETVDSAEEAPVIDDDKKLAGSFRNSSTHEEAVIVHTLDTQRANKVDMVAKPKPRSIPLEEYLYHADLQYSRNESAMLAQQGKGELDGDAQAVEATTHSPAVEISRSPIRFIWGPPTPHVQTRPSSGVHNEKKTTAEALMSREADMYDANDGFDGQDRALLRRLTIVTAFFLLTTDILGPFQAPYAVSQLGFVPAALLFVVLGLAAFLGGIYLSTLYIRLDSDSMPIRSYSGLAHRAWGRYGQIIVEGFLFLQLLFNCAGLVLTNGQSLGQIIDGVSGGKHHVCFSVIVLVFLTISVILSQIRSLHSIGPASFAAVFLSITSMITCVAFAFSSPPNYDEARITFGIQPGPVRTAAFENLPLSKTLTGVLVMVFSYGGALLYVDILNEMRRPWSFYKSLFFAQVFIMVVYMGFGMTIYARQGQFTQSLAYYGVSKYVYQTVGNVIGFTTGTIVALLYGNVAQKQVYYVVVRGWCKGPHLMTRQAFKWWMLGNTIFWCLAYVVGVSVPQVQTVAGFVAALCTIQFSYSFPFLLKLTFDIQVDAMREDRPYIPIAAQAEGSNLRAHRIDTWKQWSRWKRGLFTGNRVGKGISLALSVASVSLALIGIGATIINISDTFKVAQATSFGCVTP